MLVSILAVASGAQLAVQGGKTAVDSSFSECVDKLSAAKSVVYNLTTSLGNGNYDAMIGNSTVLAKMTPDLLESCYEEDKAAEMRLDFNDSCIDAMAEFAKGFVKTIQGADNETFLARQVLVLKGIYHKKVKAQCGFLENQTNLQSESYNVLNCSKWCLTFSKEFGLFEKHYNHSEYALMAEDAAQLLNKLIPLAYSCGETGFSQLIASWVPQRCSESLAGLLKDWVVISDQRTSWSTFFTVLLKMTSDYSALKATCPYFS